VLGEAGVSETYRVVLGEQVVDVDGPHGSFSFTAVPRFLDPAETLAAGSLLAPMPASVVSVAVELGAQVRKGDPVVLLEAMKMQHTIAAPVHGVVTGLAVSPGEQVSAGAVLAVIEEK
jgi:propionyl-CoA carboxylase alpha chain